jgi:hypothetical protein
LTDALAGLRRAACTPRPDRAAGTFYRQNGRLAPVKHAFTPRILAENSRIGAAQASFSFREVSDFNGLERLLLPTPHERALGDRSARAHKFGRANYFSGLTPPSRNFSSRSSQAALVASDPSAATSSPPAAVGKFRQSRPRGRADDLRLFGFGGRVWAFDSIWPSYPRLLEKGSIFFIF